MQVTVMSLPDTFDKTSDTIGIFGTVHEKKNNFVNQAAPEFRRTPLRFSS